MSSNSIIVASAIAALVAGKEPTLSQLLVLSHLNQISGSTATVKDERGHAFANNGFLVTAGAGKFGDAANASTTGWGEVTLNSGDAFGTGDVTMEMWLYPTSFLNNTACNGILGPVNQGQANGFTLYVDSTGSLHVGNGVNPVASSAGGALTLNKWQHVAVTREGGVVRIWVDGKKVAEANASWNVTALAMKVFFTYYSGGYGYLRGYMDEIRVCKGIALYSNEFAVPTAAFTLPSA